MGNMTCERMLKLIDAGLRWIDFDQQRIWVQYKINTSDNPEYYKKLLGVYSTERWIPKEEYNKLFGE